MAKSKRILSVVLSIVMILTVVPMGAISTGAVNYDTASSAITNDGKLVIPQVTLEATPVFRIANSSNHFLAGSTLVNATDSGQPEITNSDGTPATWATQFYAGEPVHGYQVVLTSDKVLSGTPTLSCSVSTLSITGPVKSGNTYTWVVSGGSATLSVGAINFTADYTYSYTDNLTGKTVSNTYKAYTSSWVDYATNGVGIYTKFERTYTWGTNTKMFWVHKILGKNTYGSRPEGNISFEKGYYSYITNTWTQDNSVEGFLRDSKSDSDGNYARSTGVDGNRAVATTYIDRNGGGASLASNNLRYSLFEASDSGSESYHICWLRVIPGISSWSADTANNSTASAQIGLNEVVNQFDVTRNSETHYNMTGTTYDDAATVDEATGNHISQYTIIAKAGAYLSKTERNANIATAVSFVISSYDKSELRAYLADLLRENDPLTKPAANSEIGLNPQEQWYSAGWSAYKSALTTAQNVLVKPNTTQNEIDSAVATLQAAVAGLMVKEANYDALDIAVANFNSKVASQYTVASWNAVLNAYDAADAVRGYSVFYQCAVDKAVDELNDALNHLEFEKADWSNLETAWEAYEALDYSIWTPESFKTVRDAVEYSMAQYEEHVNDYTVNDQAIIDAMEASIWTAIDGLEAALADYTAYDAEVERYNTIVLPEKAAIEASLTNAGIDWQGILATIGSPTIYEKKSWNRMQNNLGLERDIKYFEQYVVDDAADALAAGIDGRTLVGALYTDVDAQVAAANALKKNKDWYTADSYKKVTDAVAAVVYDKKIDEQAAVNAYADAIRTAIAGLVEADADYSEYDRLCGVAEEIDPSLYTDDSYNAVFDAIDAVNQNYFAKDQATLNTEIAAIQTAIDHLEYLPADYTAINAAINNWNARTDKDDYTAESVANVGKAINDVVWTKNITEQADVNAMLTAINTAISKLQLKSADYSALEAQYETAKAKINQQSSFKAANGGKDYYTADTFKALTDAVAALNLDASGNLIKDKTIREQADVNAMASSLAAAIAGLKANGADLSKLQAAIDKIPEDIEEEGIYEVESAAAVLAIAVEAQGIIDDPSAYTVENQAEIDTLADSLEEAIAALTLNSANYDALIAQVNRQRTDFADLTIYVPEKVAAVNAALAKISMDADGNVIKNKTIKEQGEVDALALELKTALDALEVAYADYSAVETAIAAANAKIETGIYTDESVAAVTAAIDAVVYNKYAKDQNAVNAMAKEINDKAADLQEKPLDLTKYNAAVASIPADLSIYTDESVAAVNNAKASADSYKSLNNKISKQGEFDSRVETLENAIAALAVKGLDLTTYNAVVASIPADLSIYTADSVAAMNAAKKAADDFKAVADNNKVTKQAEFEALVAAFDSAVKALTELPLNLDKYNAAVASVPADLSIYTDASIAAMNAAKDAADAFITANNKISKQADFDKKVAAYETAIANLKYKSADYSELDALVEFAGNLDPDDFDNYWDVYFEYISDYIETTIPANRGYNITEQAEVNAMTATLQSYIDMLNGRLLGITVETAPAKTSYLTGETADYTGLVVKANYAGGKSVTLEDGSYTLTGFDSAAAGQKTITVAFEGETATFDVTVEWGPADYTALNALVAYVNNLNDNFGVDEDGTEYVNFDEIYWGYMFDFLGNLNDKYGYTAEKQGEVDTLTAELQGYVDMLETAAPAEHFEFTGTAATKAADGVTYVYGFRTSMTEAQFKNGGYFEAENVTVTVQKSSSRYIGTGSVITVTYASGKVEEYIVIIYGDIDGNAKVDTTDAMALADSLTGDSAPLAGAQKLAANVYGTGSRVVINDQDLAGISSVAAGEAEIDQTTGKVVD